MTMYAHYNKKARDLILYFFKKYFGDPQKIAVPRKKAKTYTSEEELSNIFSADNYKGDYKILSTKVRELGEKIPPMFNAYMKLSPTMKIFGTAVNDHFGEVEETGLMIIINDIYENKTSRHLEGF